MIDLGFDLPTIYLQKSYSYKIDEWNNELAQHKQSYPWWLSQTHNYIIDYNKYVICRWVGYIF